MLLLFIIFALKYFQAAFVYLDVLCFHLFSLPPRVYGILLQGYRVYLKSKGTLSYFYVGKPDTKTGKLYDYLNSLPRSD